MITINKENDFKTSLALDSKQWQEIKQTMADGLLNTYEHYQKIYNAKESEEYLHNVIAAIMIEHNEIYHGTEIYIPYRYKAPKSLLDKLIDYLGRTDGSSRIKLNEELEKYVLSFKDITDIFAMKIIAYTRTPRFNSSDSKINELIEEKMKNYELLTQMQTFEHKEIYSDEFEKDKKYIYLAKKIDYYTNCKKVLKRIMSLLASEATELKKYYNTLLDTNNKILALLEANGIENEPIDEKDLQSLNFCNILQDFSERIHDKLDLAVLTKQIYSMFNSSKLLKDLGVKIGGMKEKRTPNGYVANFLSIETLIGTIECQLQSKHEYEAGNYGYAAHTKLDSKYINPYKIPNIRNKKEINYFRNSVEFISPRSFLAQMDTVEKNRVLTQVSSKYQNYKNVVDQISKDSDIERFMLRYFGTLYPNRDKIFGHEESDMGFMKYDIEEYLKSPNFSKIKERASKQEIELEQ